MTETVTTLEKNVGAPNRSLAKPYPRVLARLLLASLTSAVLLSAAYLPLPLGWLAWFALVPLLALVRSPARPWRVYSAAWIMGLVFFWFSIRWMRVADWRMYFTWAMLATYCSLYVPLAIWMLRRIDRSPHLPFVLAVPIVWTGLEFVRSFLGTGFAWYFLGHTQHEYLPLIQIADLGGAYTVSFVVAAGNAWLFEICLTQPWFRRLYGLSRDRMPWTTSLLLQGGCLAALVGGALIYGTWRLAQECITPGPWVALLQGNLDQRLRLQAANSETAAYTMIHHYADLSRIALAAKPPPALIVWPETSFPMDCHQLADGQPLPPWSLLLKAMAKGGEAEGSLIASIFPNPGPSVLLGLNTTVKSLDGKADTRFCSALMLHPNGTLGGRYDKMHRVPFGEYVPLRGVLPFMENFAPYDFDYSIIPGTHFTRFTVGSFRFGTLICFEDTDPYLARQYVVPDQDGPPVDFLVNISNDGWFDGSSEHEDHLAICRFRAIETRCAIARAVNMGISALIDSNGRVLAPGQPSPPSSGEFYRLKDTYGAWTDALHMWQVNGSSALTPSLPISQWQSFKKVAGVLLAQVPIDHRVTLYALAGDWLGWGCLALSALGVAWALFRRRFFAVEQGCGPA